MKNSPNKPGARKFQTLALSLLSSVFLLTLPASAQTNPPPATATRPASPEQSSVPNQAPPASRTQTTGEVSPDPTIKKMNEDEKRKVEKEGK
ncbi:hypothetical protein [Bradyrhizobium sp.]|uniref:hypothetical protein n=1 Tax=Bradyrhizobium sp. TaxID=376 RepID=UPI001D325281|nr:hypothetical protein [Bradyrhizobium sp.]MBV8697835.1 hypothetical protein [Bradyrhizobium sp.]MBV8918321.1 hypothetical protein [Bradyrhizobium sp.]MBV9983035.1 hypothetical protein [Bradyrhizobium sp.]